MVLGTGGGGPWGRSSIGAGRGRVLIALPTLASSAYIFSASGFIFHYQFSYSSSLRKKGPRKKMHLFLSAPPISPRAAFCPLSVSHVPLASWKPLKFYFWHREVLKIYTPSFLLPCTERTVFFAIAFSLFLAGPPPPISTADDERRRFQPPYSPPPQ